MILAIFPKNEWFEKRDQDFLFTTKNNVFISFPSLIELHDITQGYHDKVNTCLNATWKQIAKNVKTELELRQNLQLIFVSIYKSRKSDNIFQARFNCQQKTSRLSKILENESQEAEQKTLSKIFRIGSNAIFSILQTFRNILFRHFFKYGRHSEYEHFIYSGFKAIFICAQCTAKLTCCGFKSEGTVGGTKKMKKSVF